MRIGQSDGNRSYFNLGGGVGCDNDNLFYFKRRFSPDVRSLIMWRFIVDRKRYNELVRSMASISDTGNDSFPGYRD